MTPSTNPHKVWTPSWVQNVTHGRWLCPPTESNNLLTGLGIDSRTIKSGQVFLAIQGDQFDGHHFTQAAINNGAAIAIVQQSDALDDTSDAGLLLVDDTVDALQQLARSYRDALRSAGCHIIAIVGSNGKTTTRHLIHAVLSSTLKGTQSPKSFNNHLGVPLTLLGASLEDDFVVAEVGTNHPGEIDALGKLLQPDSAVITCIGKEHMEFFGNLLNVANEEAAITQYLPKDGKVFIESQAYQWVRKTKVFNTNTQTIVYAPDPTQTQTQHTNLAGKQQLTISNTVTINLPLIAPHDLTNAQAAVEVGRAMGTPDELIKSALESVSPMPGRLEIKHMGTVTLIDDTYNANPDSTLAALNVLADFPTAPTGRRVAILGDMLELGDLTEDSHREIAQKLSQMSDSKIIQLITLIGPCMSLAADELTGSQAGRCLTHYTSIDKTTPTDIAALIQPNDVVLLKASRGMQLEQLLPAMQHRFNP
jgi:UDP-N-acetylmuramoyl-tripeptide--D-alanyl-D-alanine ligase